MPLQALRRVCCVYRWYQKSSGSNQGKEVQECGAKSILSIKCFFTNVDVSLSCAINSIFFEFLFMLLSFSFYFHFSLQRMSLMATSEWGNMLIGFPRMFKTAVQEMLHIFSQFRVREEIWRCERRRSTDSRKVNAEAVLLMSEWVLGTDSDWAKG